MSVTLDDAWAKLAWAGKHFEAIRPDIEAFEKRDEHTFSFKVNPDEGKYTFYVRGLDTPNPDWGLVIGDCLHNARTALDYLMVRLVSFVTGQAPRTIKTTQFPIYPEPTDFAARMGTLRKNPILSGYLTRVEELQPFNSGNPSIWGRNSLGIPILPLLPAALDRLSALDNIDKHRVIHAVWLGTELHARPLPGVPSDYGFKGSSVRFGPFEDDAEVGDVTFETPLTHDWHPTQMDMKAYFALQVAFDEPVPVNGVLKIVPFCLWGVEAVLKIFEPVFTHGKPPLPVTTVLSDEELYPGEYQGPPLVPEGYQGPPIP